MLTCVPLSLCSWDYRIEGTGRGSAEVRFDLFTEQGAILVHGHEHRVRKHGVMSGHWTLEDDARTIAEGRKPSAFLRSFELDAGHDALRLDARSAFTRCYDLHRGSLHVGSIEPAHAMTRRAFLRCDPGVPDEIQLFAFWLVALTWRRAASSNS